MAEGSSMRNLMDVHAFAFVLFVTQLSFHYTQADVPTYYLDEYCASGSLLDMGLARVQAGRLLLRHPDRSLQPGTCIMYIRAPANKMLTFKFHSFNIQSPQGCNDNYFRIFQDREGQLPLTDRLCNTNRVPDRAYVTSGEDARLELSKDKYLGDQIELVFTAFTFFPCKGGEYQCDNAHCISQSLYCNGYDNCGDESDYCLLRTSTVIAIIIVAVVVVVIIGVIIAIFLIRRQRKIRREREKEFFSDLASSRIFETHDNKGFLGGSDWEKRTISDGSSIYSSTIHKKPSLLSKRDGQIKRVIDYKSAGGLRVSSLDRRPRMHPYDSEMASKIHYIVQDGSSRPSTLERKIRRSRESSPRTSTLDRRSKSVDLHPPFYFDKDGYLSDTGVWHTSEDVYATPKKRKKTEKNNRKVVSRGSSSVGPADDVDKHIDERKSKKKEKKKDKKKDKGKERTSLGYMTPPVDYDTVDAGPPMVTPTFHTETEVKTSQTTNGYVPQAPLIYVTPPDTTVEKLVKNVSHSIETYVADESFTDGGISQLPEVSTLTTSLEVDDNSGRETSETDQQEQEKILKRRLSSSTKNSDKNGRLSNKGSDVDGRSSSKVSIVNGRSSIILPDVNGRSSARTSDVNGRSSIVASDVNGRSGIVASDVNGQSGIITSKVNGRPGTKRSSTKDSDINGQQSNIASEVNGRPGSKTYDVNGWSGIETAGVKRRSGSKQSDEMSSATRQSAMSARHRDGSPYQIHTADSRRVAEQLKIHPEDGADVFDHVISFRSYPSPVPELEKQLFRHSHRRSGSEN